MKGTGSTGGKIFCAILLVFFAFGALCFHGALDYVNKCVSVHSRDVTSIEVGRLYSVNELFLIERAKDNASYDLHISGDNVTYEVFSDPRLFRITGGTGKVNIYLSVMNDDSPESRQAEIALTIVS